LPVYRTKVRYAHATSERRPGERRWPPRSSSRTSRGDVRDRGRRCPSALCTGLCTAWGRICSRPGATRDQPVDAVGTTTILATSPLMTGSRRGVDNFPPRHAGTAPSACRDGGRDRPPGASDRSLGDAVVTPGAPGDTPGARHAGEVPGT
jgi:hypothetical protein